MTLIDRCAETVKRVLREERDVDLSLKEALNIARQVFSEAREPSEEVLFAVCELECRRPDCERAGSCRGHYLQQHKQRWEMAVSTILAVHDDA